jgi:hypothetical protein
MCRDVSGCVGMCRDVSGCVAMCGNVSVSHKCPVKFSLRRVQVNVYPSSLQLDDSDRG